MSDLTNHRIATLEDAQQANVAYQREVMGILRGGRNGDLGLLHTVAVINTRLETVEEKLDGLKDSSSGLKESIDALRQERRDDQKKREGRVELAGWVKYVLLLLGAIVAIGGPLGLWRVSTQFQHVQQQLRNIPSIPE